jgi:hypothetical protein
MFENINHKLFKMKNILVSIVLLFTTYSFTQEITGVTKTGDKYSLMIRESNEGYFKNDFTIFDKIMHDDAVITINREDFTKDEVRSGFAFHHQLYKDIKANPEFIETTFYDENNNNQVWSHLWQFWEGTSKRNGETIRGPVNASFKWVDGKIIRALYIYDSVPISTEIAAVQKK